MRLTPLSLQPQPPHRQRRWPVLLRVREINRFTELDRGSRQHETVVIRFRTYVPLCQCASETTFGGTMAKWKWFVLFLLLNVPFVYMHDILDVICILRVRICLEIDQYKRGWQIDEHWFIRLLTKLSSPTSSQPHVLLFVHLGLPEDFKK